MVGLFAISPTKLTSSAENRSFGALFNLNYFLFFSSLLMAYSEAKLKNNANETSVSEHSEQDCERQMSSGSRFEFQPTYLVS
jgi:hypothetical protein